MSERRELLQEQKQEIREAFTLFDLDNDGLLDKHELRAALRALGLDSSRETIQQHFINNIDNNINSNTVSSSSSSTNNTSNTVSYDTFFRGAASLTLSRDPKEEVRRAFQLFTGGRDTLTVGDLRRVANELGESITETELIAMIDEFDNDGDGALSWDEFASLIME